MTLQTTNRHNGRGDVMNLKGDLRLLTCHDGEGTTDVVDVYVTRTPGINTVPTAFLKHQNKWLFIIFVDPELTEHKLYTWVIVCSSAL